MQAALFYEDLGGVCAASVSWDLRLFATQIEVARKVGLSSAQDVGKWGRSTQKERQREEMKPLLCHIDANEGDTKKSLPVLKWNEVQRSPREG